MRFFLFGLACIASVVAAQDEESSSIQEVITLSGSERRLTEDASLVPTVSDFEASTFATGSVTEIVISTGAPNATASMSTSTEEESLTEIVGGTRTTSNGTASTATAPLPSNTQPCNGYPEFCNRKYSNITEVCAHNSPFVRERNIASNQVLGVTQQLNDGIRMLQGQTHYVNGTLYYCHTSCDLLNAGTVEDYLREVTKWVASHPFDVITILFGNADFQMKDDAGNPLVTARDFVDPIEKSGLKQFIYQPPKTAMALDDWPTLSEMILSGKRVVTFIDYNFDTKTVPYLLWEFYNIWETPFSPTDPEFPCVLGRPEGLKEEKQQEMMYIANHNLNVEVSVGSFNILIPNSVELNITNGLNGTGSLGDMTKQCTERHGRPPNFLLVDYYNIGPFNGSVFEVAARANNVTYNGKCCGGKESMAAELIQPSVATLGLVIAIVAALIL